jgi:hypothetical protein
LTASTGFLGPVEGLTAPTTWPSQNKKKKKKKKEKKKVEHHERQCQHKANKYGCFLPLTGVAIAFSLLGKQMKVAPPLGILIKAKRETPLFPCT